MVMELMSMIKTTTIKLIIIVIISLVFNNSNNLNEIKPSITTVQSNSPINVEKVVLFSSASALNDSTNPWWNLNVYQYSDIAVYLSQNDQSNIATSIVLDNFQFIDGPKLGTPICTYISPLNLGKSSYDIHSAINSEKIVFDVKNASSEETFETPTFFNNYSSPLTFRYVNKNIVKDYLLHPDESSSLTFDGTLLKKCLIKKEDISCKISFDITYIISESESYKYNVSFDILLENDEQSIFDGNFLKTISPEDISIKQI